jgi:polo-like kinase 1
MEQELAKIQTTIADTIASHRLITATEQQPGTELITKFVDFSTKYGLGYKMSNGAYGVLFNDSTKIVTISQDLFHFCYIERVKDSAGGP